MEKKRLVVSYKNLSDKLKEELQNQYPAGYGEALLKIDKGPGSFFYAVPFETEEAKYLVKIDVKVDLNHDEDEEEVFEEENIIGDENVGFSDEDEDDYDDDYDEPDDDAFDEDEDEDE